MVIITEAALNLSQRKRDLAGKLEKRAYQTFRETAQTSKELKDALYKSRIQVFQEELSRLISQSGCTKQTGSLTNQVIRDTLLAEAQLDGDSMVNTFNYHLIGAIKKVNSDKWSDYFTQIKNWKLANNQYKVDQVSTWASNRTRNMAQQEFYRRNKKQLRGKGVAILRGPVPAKEPICAGWLKRGKVPLNEALGVLWPPHLNCKHFWEIVKFAKVNFLRRRTGGCDKL